MTYGPSSSIVGYQPVRAGWRDVLIAHGAVPDADTILATYDQWCKQLNLDPNLALAQACHECTYFTSERWQGAAGVPPEWNSAGLGITANNTPPNPFTSPQEGIEAHIEHICAYTYIAATCPVNHQQMADRRHTFHEGYTDLAGLERSAHWAFPGTGYVDSIVAIANSIGGIPMTVPWDRVHISADLGPERTLASIKWGIVHDTEGHFDGDELVLTSAGPPVESANILIGREPGQCVLIAPLTTTAWAAGNDGVGIQAFQVELSKGTDENGYTDYQYTKLAECFRYARAQGMVNVPFVYLGLHPADANGGPEPDDAGIIGHAGVPNPAGLGVSPAWGGFGGHTDPGPSFDWPRFIGILGNAPPPPMDERFFPDTNEKISGNFKGYWERFGTDEKGIALSMELFGFPVTPIVQENGIDVQYFERWVFEDHTAEGKGVLGRRLGAAAAKAAGHTGPGID